MRMDADFLLLDEPFRGLDAGTKKKTMNYIRRKGKEKTMLLVTHDLEEAEAMGDWICTCSRHSQLVAQRDKGKAVLLVSLELDEVMDVSDRILVMYEGELVGQLDQKTVSVEELGLYMAGAKRDPVPEEV